MRQKSRIPIPSCEKANRTWNFKNNSYETDYLLQLDANMLTVNVKKAFLR